MAKNTVKLTPSVANSIADFLERQGRSVGIGSVSYRNTWLRAEVANQFQKRAEELTALVERIADIRDKTRIRRKAAQMIVDGVRKGELDEEQSWNTLIKLRDEVNGLDAEMNAILADLEGGTIKSRITAVSEKIVGEIGRLRDIANETAVRIQTGVVSLADGEEIILSATSVAAELVKSLDSLVEMQGG